MKLSTTGGSLLGMMNELRHTETSAPRKSPAQRQLWGTPPPPHGWRSFLPVLWLAQLLATAATFVVALLAGAAYAQTAGDPAPAAVDPMALLKAIFDGVHSGNGWLAAGPALTLVVWALRKYDLQIPKVGPAIDKFLNQPLVAFLLPAVLSALTGLFGSLALHMPLAGALLTALKVAGGAALTFLFAKNAAEQVKGAQAAGASAAKNPGPTLGA